MNELAKLKIENREAKEVAKVESSLHQLSPYVGKIKSSIARSLIEEFSEPGGIVLDPFSGSGTIGLEAILAGRDSICHDVNDYSKVLSLGKFSAPKTVDEALNTLANIYLNLPKKKYDLRKIPKDIRKFFNKDTLREILAWRSVLSEPGNEFYFACFLGILHHQRPGFLSFPSSHLVPYLRDKKYPIDIFPEMYAKREVYPRMQKKIQRALKNITPAMGEGYFSLTDINYYDSEKRLDAIITSPPYANALDYFRDNRLRLWMITGKLHKSCDTKFTSKSENYDKVIRSLVLKVVPKLKTGGYCVLVVGDNKMPRSGGVGLHQYTMKIFEEIDSKLQLCELRESEIPQKRRSRRNCSAIKKEYTLVFKKNG